MIIIMNNKFDVIVVGCGPAGAQAAKAGERSVTRRRVRGPAAWGLRTLGSHRANVVRSLHVSEERLERHAAVLLAR